ALLKSGFEFMTVHLAGPGRVLGLTPKLGFFPIQVSVWLVLAGLSLGTVGSLVSLVGLERSRA
ncbi:MAG: ABC transporter permease, partial [Nitrospirota bacterium]|nr:ABC transporter permease [Nitrospirota bacterium]